MVTRINVPSRFRKCLRSSNNRIRTRIVPSTRFAIVCCSPKFKITLVEFCPLLACWKTFTRQAGFIETIGIQRTLNACLFLRLIGIMVKSCSQVEPSIHSLILEKRNFSGTPLDETPKRDISKVVNQKKINGSFCLTRSMFNIFSVCIRRRGVLFRLHSRRPLRNLCLHRSLLFLVL